MSNLSSNMTGKNPCDICHQKQCFGCILNRYNRVYVCKAYDCMLNYEDSCILNIYDVCGCRMEADGIALKDEEDEE